MKKDGGVRLLEKEHHSQTNPWDKPVVGWRETSQGEGGLFNPMGFAMLRVVTHKEHEGEMRALYDQPMIVESPGSIVICQAGDKIGLVKNFRMVGPRLMPDAGRDYVATLDEQKCWKELADVLGQWKWECPRGLAPPGTDPSDLERFVIQTAKIEAGEEGGFAIKNPRICGWLNSNPTFFAHPQAVVHAEIDAVGDAKPENLEIIGGAELFGPEQIRGMAARGELDDGLTLAGLALAGYRF